MDPVNLQDGGAARRTPRAGVGRRLRIAAVALLLAGGAVAAWYGGARNFVFPKRWDKIAEPALYRSGQISGRLIESTLRRHGIRTVVDLTDRRTRTEDRETERLAIRDLGLERIRAPLEGDGRGDPESYVLALRAMTAAVRTGRPTLVHCQSGVQRVGGVVAAFRLLIERRPPAEVRAELDAKGWDPKDDRVLEEFLDANLGTIAARLVEEGILERVPDPLPLLGSGRPAAVNRR